MSTLQPAASNPWIPRLLLWGPAGLGGLLALAVLAVGSVPLISQLQLQGSQVGEKRAQELRLPQLRAQLSQLQQQQGTAERQQQQLISLIAGSGELVTFMAQADREARRHGVQLQLYEPTPVLAAAEPEEVDALKGQSKGTRRRIEKEAAARKEAETAAQKDPLQQAGLKSTQLLLSARGRYPNLLAFLRAMESLSLLVVQSNLNLNQALPEQAGSAAQAAAKTQVIPPVELKFSISLYSDKARI